MWRGRRVNHLIRFPTPNERFRTRTIKFLIILFRVALVRKRHVFVSVFGLALHANKLCRTAPNMRCYRVRILGRFRWVLRIFIRPGERLTTHESLSDTHARSPCLGARSAKHRMWVYNEQHAKKVNPRKNLLTCSFFLFLSTVFIDRQSVIVEHSLMGSFFFNR